MRTTGAWALGGGAVLSEAVQSALAHHTTVLLDVEPDVAEGDSAADDDSFGLLDELFDSIESDSVESARAGSEGSN